MSSEFAVWLGLVTGLAAVAIWTIVFVRSVLDWSRRDERRVTWLVMAGTALLAAMAGVIVLTHARPPKVSK
jgi:uncharacterized membrane protein